MNQRSKLPYVGDTIFSEMNAVASETNSINLGQGFPDYQPDSGLLDAVCQAMMQGPNQYAPMIGVASLRQAIASKVMALQGHLYDADQEITITSGATEALSASILALVHQGDEVVLIDPAYDLYAPVVTLAGGKPVRVGMLPPAEGRPGFLLDWDALDKAIHQTTRLLILNFPHNPTGLILSEPDLDALEHIAEKKPFLILSDEAYEHIVFDDQPYYSPASRPSLAARCVLVSSFAKTLQITGWKIGYCCAPVEISREIRKVHQYMVFSVNTPLQRGIAEYLGRNNPSKTISTLYQRKRDRFVQGLAATGFRPLPCQGTFFLLVDATALGADQEKQIAVRLAKSAGVAAIPVSAFYDNPNAAKANHGLLRFCFAKQDTTLDAAIERLSAC